MTAEHATRHGAGVVTRMAGSHQIRCVLIVTLVTAAALAGCARDRTPSALVVVTLDTTRADRLPAYGFASVAAPAIDRLAREGVVFDRAESVAPLTLPAHASIFTGLYPTHHGVRDNADAPLHPSHVTLAEILHARGYRTAAFVGSTVLAADRGLARGFDVYDDGGAEHVPPPRRRTASAVINNARAWIQTLEGGPFFLWVHLYDVHAPQTLPLEFRRTYGDRYEGAIAYLDSEIARLLDTLEGKRMLASAAIVVAGDHGESLGEHGEREHGIFLYEGAMRVPLIIRAPGLKPRRVDDMTTLVDVLPTMLDLFGIDMQSARADGLSLLPVLKGKHLADRVVYGESMYPRRFGWSPLRMVRDAHAKYIDAPRPELYDLDSDPFEQRDVLAKRPTHVAAMRAYLSALDSGLAAGRTGANSVDSERRAALAALGYVSSGALLAPTRFDIAPDPKDYIHVFNSVRGRFRQ